MHERPTGVPIPVSRVYLPVGEGERSIHPRALAGVADPCRRLDRNCAT